MRRATPRQNAAQWLRSALAATCALALASGLLGQSSVQSGVLAHERLRVRNTFKTPEEVVAYYCARDASGFVWSGLLDAERTAFTAWADAPQVDSFYIAKSYRVHATSGAADGTAHEGALAQVEVSYDLSAVGDAHGTRTPPPRSDYHVTFDLKRIDGRWKIVKPDYAQIAPVVLESKFK